MAILMARVTNIRRIRNLLLLIMVAIIASLGGLFVFGRMGKDPIRKPMEEGEASQAGQGTALIGDDFDYTFTEREKPLFRIRGDSIRADQGGTIYLDGVGLTLYDEQGRAYHVESREASFNRESNEGRLQGNVYLKGPQGLVLRTAQLQINQKGRVLISPKPVMMRYADMYTAKADRMRVNLDEEMFVLAGRSRVESLPGAEMPLSLTGERTVYDRKQRLLRIEGNAVLKRGNEQVRSKRMSANLTPDESGLVFVRAQWEVSGRLSSDSENVSKVRFSGRDLAVQFQPGSDNQARKVVLEGGEQNRAMLETQGVAGTTRTLTALQVEGQLAQGVLTTAEAFGGVELRETTRASGQKEVRKATGQRADAGFRPDGQLASINLLNKVTFRDQTTRATGNRASLDLDSGRGEFFGDPVEAVSERGRMTAPRILYNVDNQILNATGGVRAVMEQKEDSELAGTALGEGEGPVHVESREAFWRKEPQSFLFRGDVRAWRGESLMLTTELRGDQAEDKLSAAGGVKTLWIPVDKANPKAKRAPVEVVSQEMTYLEGGDLLTYTGSVRVVQEGKTLTCNKLDVELTEENRAETMICTGDVRVNDPKEGRQIAGQKAVYDLAAKRMEITGDKVTMKDRDGNQVQGRRVIYSVDDGKVEVKGKEGAAAAPVSPISPAPATPGTGSGRG